MRAVAEALQSEEVAAAVRGRFGAAIGGTYLRLEYAVDVDGFWLEPHTDLGVKKFTCLIYLSGGPADADLGTDIYAAGGQRYARSPFRPNGAMAFVPGADTWHGFAPRPIAGLRKSVIMNYVGDAWRARDQLAFPDTPLT